MHGALGTQSSDGGGTQEVDTYKETEGRDFQTGMHEHSAQTGTGSQEYVPLNEAGISSEAEAQKYVPQLEIETQGCNPPPVEAQGYGLQAGTQDCSAHGEVQVTEGHSMLPPPPAYNEFQNYNHMPVTNADGVVVAVKNVGGVDFDKECMDADRPPLVEQPQPRQVDDDNCCSGCYCCRRYEVSRNQYRDENRERRRERRRDDHNYDVDSLDGFLIWFFCCRGLFHSCRGDHVSGGAEGNGYSGDDCCHDDCNVCCCTFTPCCGDGGCNCECGDCDKWGDCDCDCGGCGDCDCGDCDCGDCDCGDCDCDFS